MSIVPRVLAASGQNVALVAACCAWLAIRLGAGRTTGAVIALLAVPGYVLVVGGGSSIMRAGIMGELGIVAWLLGRLADVRQLLLVAAAAICWAWPGAHRGLGMQLSFACVIALAWWARPATARLRDAGIPGWLASGLAASTLCAGATAPILALRTGAAPFVGTIANLVAIPLAGLVLVAGLAGALATILGDALGARWVAGIAMRPALVLAGLLRDVARRASQLPLAQVTAPELVIVLPLLALAAAIVLPRLPGERRRAAAGVVGTLALGCLLIGLAAALPIGSVPGLGAARGGVQPVQPGQLRIAVLDIGQGDATLIAGAGAAVLVDTGPPDGRVVERVRALGVRRLDGIVLTHDSLDHRGGFDAARAALHPRWVAIPRRALGAWGRVQAGSPHVVELCAGDSIELAQAQLAVLHPRCDGRVTPRTGDLHNDAAMVLLVRHGDVRAVLPADAEAPVLAGLALPRLDLLRISHHGSADPALPLLLGRVRPGIAAISVGDDNGYGHPRASTLAALRAAGVPTLRTDRDGTVAFDSDGHRLVRVA